MLSAELLSIPGSPRVSLTSGGISRRACGRQPELHSSVGSSRGIFLDQSSQFFLFYTLSSASCGTLRPPSTLGSLKSCRTLHPDITSSCEHISTPPPTAIIQLKPVDNEWVHLLPRHICTPQTDGCGTFNFPHDASRARLLGHTTRRP